MAVSRETVKDSADRIRGLAGEWAKLRERACLLYVSRSIEGGDVLAIRDAVAGLEGEPLDVMIASPGGHASVAYLVARELRRRCPEVTAVVPLRAKSAATLLCLACDEIILSSLGELGPLDEQVDEKQEADFPAHTSRLVPFKALAQFQTAALDTFDAAVNRILEQSGMRPYDACAKAAELTASLYGHLYAKLDPTRLGESARCLEVGSEYALRLLRRYRPGLEADKARELIRRLVHGYPSHGFVIDYEEAQDLGLPVRLGKEGEIEILEKLATALIQFGTDEDLIERTAPPPGAIEAAAKVLDGLRGTEAPKPVSRGRKAKTMHPADA